MPPTSARRDWIRALLLVLALAGGAGLSGCGADDAGTTARVAGARVNLSVTVQTPLLRRDRFLIPVRDLRRLHLRRLLLARPHDPPLRPSVGLRAVAARILTPRVGGQRVVVMLSRHPNGRAVLFAHGRNQTPNSDVDDPRSGQLITALLRHGYAYAESTADFNNWGNAKSLRADVALARWLRRHHLGTIDVGGDSMGGLDAVQLIPLLHPQAVFELFPVCNEHSMLGLFGPEIRRVHAPLAQLSPVPMRDVAGLPMLITASPADTLVRKSANADVCAAEARAAGAQVREVTTVGEHDDPSNWQPARILALLDTAAADQPPYDGAYPL